MKIGIIGTGRMGSALGTLWSARRKHQVFYGSRKRIKADSLAQVSGPESHGGIYEEAAEFGEVVVIALPWHAVENHITRIAPYLVGKTVIDITNPLTPKAQGFAIDGNTSAAQIIQSLVPEAHVVKAFNGVYFENLENPMFNGKPAEVYYCGNDEAAKAQVADLITDLKFTPVDLGGLEMARYLEAMVYIWIQRLYAGKHNGTDTIINIMRR